MAVAASGWYVIQCKAREDGRALEHLQRQAFCCFAPTLRVEKLRQGRRIAVQEPMFPGYLFVKLDEVNGNWHRIRSTRGVLKLVHFNDRLVPIEDRIIDRIRERLAVHQPCVPYLKPGERVVITEGAFSDVDAIFLANDGSDRVMLLMNILHREQRLSFPASIVRKTRDVVAAS
jgi:transcriptional antiterminator RfaH